MALAQVKAGDTSKQLLNKIIYSLCQAKEIIKAICSYIMNSIIIIQNEYYEKSKTSDPYKLLLSLSDKINLKRSDKCVASSNLSI